MSRRETHDSPNQRVKLLSLLFACIFLPVFVRAAGEANFFLPQNPVAAAYVLGRLSNRELIEAPRSEFVYVALLQRKGLDRKYRLEALDGLAGIRHSDRATQLLLAIADLDKKGGDAEETLRELGALLLQSDRAELSSRRAELDPLKTQGKLSLTRQIAFAACVTADSAPEPSWDSTKSKPEQRADLVLCIRLLVDASLRAAFYEKVRPLLMTDKEPELRRAAIDAVVFIPGHDSDTFESLSALIQSGVEVRNCCASLETIPRSSWPVDRLQPTVQALIHYLSGVPADQRADAAFTRVLEFANELASRLPPDFQKTAGRTLRQLGPTIVALHAVYEQMRFDREVIAVEAGKPVVMVLQNDDAMPHNLAVLAPGALKEIGLAAEKMAPEPDSEGRLYIPASPKVLHATKLVNPGQKAQLVFNAPAEEGDYPFVCTFPGHWLRMTGTVVVRRDLDAYLASHNLAEPKLTEWKLSDFTADFKQPAVRRNVEAGRELFSKLACITCHKLGTNGYTFGPELTDVLTRYKGDRLALLQQILEPSKVIEERYRNVNFDLKTDEPATGIVLKEDDKTVTIQTGPADSLIQILKKSDIQQRRLQASSPMPVGLLNGLSREQIFDLLAYLESGGTMAAHAHQHP